MREYEIMVIVDQDADDKVVDGVVDRITQVLTEGGGEVAGVDRWGKRKLAYEIDHKTEGHYLLITFTAEPSALPELERVLSLADEVVRFKVATKAA
jgi:small subunit ribosomal protein S6